MVDRHPEANEAYRVGVRDKRKLVDEVLSKGKEIYDGLSGVRAKMAHYYGRRHCMIGRDPQTPWRGSANVVMPLIDKHVTKDKAGPISLLARPRIIEASGLDADSYRRAQFMETYLNSVVQGDAPVHSQQDFHRQFNLAMENRSQHGPAFTHWGWCRKSRVAWEEIRQTDLPGVLKVMVFDAGMSQFERAAMMQAFEQRGQEMNPPEVMQLFGQYTDGQPVNPVDGETFKRIEPKLKEMISEAFGFEDGEALDKQALGSILAWMRLGAKDTHVVKMRVLIADHPEMRSVQPTDFIAPIHTEGVDTPPIIIERMRLFEHELYDMGYDRRWSVAAMDRAVQAADEEQSFFGGSEAGFDWLEGHELDRLMSESWMPNNPVERVEVFRICFYMRAERGRFARVMAYVQPHTQTILEIAQHPGHAGHWGYLDIPYEENEPGLWTPRGVGEIIDDSDAYLTMAHRQRLNSAMVTNARGYFVRKGRGLENLRWSPSMVVETDDPQTDVREIQMAPQGGEWSQEEFFHQVWVEDHLGSNDTNVRDARLLEPITATESQNRERNQGKLGNTRGSIVMKRLTQGFNIWCSLAQKWAPNRIMATVGDGEPSELRREQLQGRFRIRMAMAVGNMDPDYQANRALQRLQVLTQMQASAPQVFNNPKYVWDMTQALIEWLDAQDPQARRRLVSERTPEEIQQILQQQQAELAEAERMAMIAKKLLANAPTSPEEQLEYAQYVTSKMPHKEVQATISNAAAQRAQLEQASDLAGLGDG